MLSLVLEWRSWLILRLNEMSRVGFMLRAEGRPQAASLWGLGKDYFLNVYNGSCGIRGWGRSLQCGGGKGDWCNPFRRLITQSSRVQPLAGCTRTQLPPVQMDAAATDLPRLDSHTNEFNHKQEKKKAFFHSSPRHSSQSYFKPTWRRILPVCPPVSIKITLQGLIHTQREPPWSLNYSIWKS